MCPGMSSVDSASADAGWGSAGARAGGDMARNGGGLLYTF